MKCNSLWHFTVKLNWYLENILFIGIWVIDDARSFFGLVCTRVNVDSKFSTVYITIQEILDASRDIHNCRTLSIGSGCVSNSCIGDCIVLCQVECGMSWVHSVRGVGENAGNTFVLIFINAAVIVNGLDVFMTGYLHDLIWRYVIFA